MDYVSTRDKNLTASAAKAIATGIAPDGGLYCPTEIPQLTAEDFASLCAKDYRGRSARASPPALPWMPWSGSSRVPCSSSCWSAAPVAASSGAAARGVPVVLGRVSGGSAPGGRLDRHGTGLGRGVRRGDDGRAPGELRARRAVLEQRAVRSDVPALAGALGGAVGPADRRRGHRRPVRVGVEARLGVTGTGPRRGGTRMSTTTETASEIPGGGMSIPSPTATAAAIT